VSATGTARIPPLRPSRLVDQAPQIGFPEARPHRIVHQHPVVRIDRARASDQAVQHTVAAARPAAVERRKPLAERAPVVLPELPVRRRKHHEHDFHFGAASRRAIEWCSIGFPASGEYCLGAALPKRVPEPAAGTRPKYREVIDQPLILLNSESSSTI